MCAASLVLVLSACPYSPRDAGLDSSSNSGSDNISSGTFGGNPSETRVIVQLPEALFKKRPSLMLCARQAELGTGSSLSSLAPFTTYLFEDHSSHLIDFDQAREGLLEIASKKIESGVYRTMTFLLGQNCEKPFAVQLTNNFGTFQLSSSEASTLTLFDLYGVVPNPEQQIIFSDDLFFNALESVTSESRLLELFTNNRIKFESIYQQTNIPPPAKETPGKGNSKK
jgi:hypothetical protein